MKITSNLNDYHTKLKRKQISIRLEKKLSIQIKMKFKQ